MIIAINKQNMAVLDIGCLIQVLIYRECLSFMKLLSLIYKFDVSMINSRQHIRLKKLLHVFFLYVSFQWINNASSAEEIFFLRVRMKQWRFSFIKSERLFVWLKPYSNIEKVHVQTSKKCINVLIGKKENCIISKTNFY